MMNEKSYESPSSFKTILIYIVLFQIANHAAIFHVSSFTLVPSWRIQKIDTRAGEALPSKQSSGKTSTALNGIRGFRAWFESQFGDAMTAFDHQPASLENKSSTKYDRRTVDKSSKSTASFDHVLIDINQLLHITLRRSKSDDHALVLLLKELDKCLSIAKPLKSIVLSFDGPPAAAKLATQRRRRYGIIVRNIKRKERIDLLVQKGLISNPDKLNRPSGKFKKKLRKEEREELTLAITPGTKFMERAEEAVLYWAWQRLSNPNGKMKIQNCRIYISPSSGPGEGEVKLLDWLFQAGNFSQQSKKIKRRNSTPILKRGDSVAIMGGDSDLVLEGLIIPPSITHNVFVILPSKNNRSYAVSLWETTLTLSRFLGSRFNVNDIMRVRTDLVLLLIMNGNDYLPKLRGSSGFNKLFHTYLYLLKKWLSKEKTLEENDSNYTAPFFVDPNTLELNLPFCIAFFEALVVIAPKSLAQQSDLIPFRRSITPLSHLYSLVDSGLFPKPATFSQTPITSEHELDNGKEIMRLSLGHKSNKNSNEGENSKDTDILDRYYEFEVSHRIGRPLKKTKQLLASIALEELLGKDYLDISDYVVGNDIEGDDDIEDNEDDEIDNSMEYMGSGGIGYSWEMETAASCCVEEYVKGLIWNLATYQDGVCSDYSYNYGRRMSPTADEMLSYFKSANETGRCIGRKELLSYKFTEPLSDGLSCLAALPIEVKHLIPQPYSSLTKDGLVEEIYSSCMDKETNVFDLNLFRQKCMNHIEQNADPSTKSRDREGPIGKRNLRKIRTGTKFWTVLRRVNQPLVHPFDPPKGFSERLAKLRNNNKIKVYHMHSTDRPRWLINQTNDKEVTKFTDMVIVSESENLENIEYLKVYQSKKQNDISILTEKTKSHQSEKILSNSPDVEYIGELSRMDLFGLSAPLQHAPQNIEGLNALQCIEELLNAGCFSRVKWSRTFPSVSDYASIDPDLYEEVKIEIIGLNVSIILSQDRNRNLFSRKSMKHHLAGLALSLIFKDDDWLIMTSNEMKSRLLLNKSPQANTVNVENRNALQCLHELKDSNMFQVKWQFSPTHSTFENVQLRIIPGSKEIEMLIEEDRDIYKTSKSASKQNLAALALYQILGEGYDWREMCLNEMKDIVQRYP